MTAKPRGCLPAGYLGGLRGCSALGEVLERAQHRRGDPGCSLCMGGICEGLQLRAEREVELVDCPAAQLHCPVISLGSLQNKRNECKQSSLK